MTLSSKNGFGRMLPETPLLKSAHREYLPAQMSRSTAERRKKQGLTRVVLSRGREDLGLWAGSKRLLCFLRPWTRSWRRCRCRRRFLHWRSRSSASPSVSQHVVRTRRTAPTCPQGHFNQPITLAPCPEIAAGAGSMEVPTQGRTCTMPAMEACLMRKFAASL